MTDDDPPTVAVTGAAGYIGSRIVHQLQRVHPDWSIVALDNFYLGDVRENGDVTVRDVDVRDRDRLEAALDGADLVMHLAAVSGVDGCEDNPDLAYEVNVRGTQNVAYHCHRTGAALIFPLSMAVLGDPESFPITVDDPRDPMNWYGRTKHVGERTIEAFAHDSFLAHLLMKSNLYGEHVVGSQRVSKGTVINFFVQRALAGEPLTVYEPGTQARNYVHVDDVARAYLLSARRLLELRRTGDTGVRAYEIASDEDPSVMAVAEQVQRVVREEAGTEPPIELVENPRGNETLVDEFAVDTTAARERLGWHPRRTVADSVRELVAARTRADRPRSQ